MWEDALCSITKQTTGMNPSPSSQPWSPRGWEHCGDGEGRYLVRGDGGNGGGS